MDLPIGFGDPINAEQAVLAAFLDQRGAPTAQAIAIDAAIHHDMRDMDAEWPVFARHALRNHAQAGLGGREMREPRLATDAGRSAGEDDGTAPQRREPARRLAPDQETAEAADAPEILELLRCQLAEIDALIVARVRRDEVR